MPSVAARSFVSGRSRFSRKCAPSPEGEHRAEVRQYGELRMDFREQLARFGD